MKAIDLNVGKWAPVEPRSRSSAAGATVIALVTGGLIAWELLRSVHTTDPGARAAVETVIALVALGTVRLLSETSDGDHQLRGLLLVLGVVVLSVGDFSYWVGSLVGGTSTAASGGATRLACQLIGAFALSGAAFVPSGVTVRPSRAQVRVAAAVGVAAILGAMVLAKMFMGSATANWTAGSLGVGADLLSATALVIAALAFVARPSQMQPGAELLAGGCLLLAAGAVQYVAMPVVVADWLTPREGARVLAFALFLGGACLRYRSVQRQRAYTAIRSERERAARDLHDGLAQDLACITTEAQRLEWNLGPQDPLMLATRDALAEVRGMIADLTASTADTSDEAVRMFARDVARRPDLEVDVRIDAGPAALTEDGPELGSRDAGLECEAGHVVVRVSGSTRGTPDERAGDATPNRRTRGVSRLSAEWSRRSRRRRPI